MAEAVNVMKNGKALRSDGIPAEVLKRAVKVISGILLKPCFEQGRERPSKTEEASPRNSMAFARRHFTIDAIRRIVDTNHNGQGQVTDPREDESSYETDQSLNGRTRDPA